jgi:hypothetical protein
MNFGIADAKRRLRQASIMPGTSRELAVVQYLFIGLNNKMCTWPDVLRAKKIRLMCTQMMPKRISNVGCFHIMKSFSGSFSLQQVFFPSMYHQDDRSVELVKLATALGDLTGIVSVRL